jgi:hypothetical protein
MAQSTIVTTNPPDNSALASAPVRTNFAAAAADHNGLDARITALEAAGPGGGGGPVVIEVGVTDDPINHPGTVLGHMRLDHVTGGLFFWDGANAWIQT